MIRVQKVLAEAGVASRRAGERMIAEGRVAVNGEVVTELGTKVDPARDVVEVDGRPVKARRKAYLALNKPRGVVCTRNDPAGRAMVTDLLPREFQHLYSVGRLDRDSEGLLFLTNDGEFSLRLTHPRYGITKKYIVTVEGKIEPALVHQITKGVRHQGELLKAQSARLLSASNSKSVLGLELREGKYREIRRICEALGLEVRSLQRIQIGKIKLGELKPGKWRALTEAEIITLLGAV